MSEATQPTTQCHIPWNLNPQKLSYENVKSCKPKGPLLYVAAVTSVDGPNQSKVSSVAGRASRHLWVRCNCQNTLIRYEVSAGLLTTDILFLWLVWYHGHLFVSQLWLSFGHQKFIPFCCWGHHKIVTSMQHLWLAAHPIVFVTQLWFTGTYACM